MTKIALAAILFLTGMPSFGQPRIPLTDHELISPYEGSVMRRKDIKEFDTYNAFMGMDAEGKEATGLSLEGKITRILYTKPKERSILEVFRNYEAAVTSAGAEILYSCNQDNKECVERYAGPTLQKYSDIHSISNLAGRYLLAKMEQDENTAYIAIAVGQSFADVHVIEIKDMDQGMVTLDAEALGKGLDARGYVIVEGIYFDTDKATLQAHSKPAMDEMAKLLNDRPDLAVYVVGHTDSQGTLAHNRALSENRARSVVESLVGDYGIASARLEGHGVGPLAPQSHNREESGRARNRRVVLVAR